jgi:GxxExxY protein
VNEIAEAAIASFAARGIPRKVRQSQRHVLCSSMSMATDALDARALNRITGAVITAAIAVHRALGSGLLESAYRKCLSIELTAAGFKCHQKRPTPLVYKGVRITPAYEADIVVENAVIVEVKAIEALHPIHERQLYTYLRLADCRVGLLLNFGGPTLRQGIRRVVNNFPEDNAENAERQGDGEATS